MVLNSNNKRFDILLKILNKENYDDIIKEGDTPSIRGFIYETIVIICIILKQLIPNYEYISDTRVSHDLIFKNINSVKELLNKSLCQGYNESDISIKIKGKGWTPFSIKYKKDKGKSQLSECQKYMESYCKQTNDNYSLGYVVKDKEILKWTDSQRDEAVVINKVKEDNHLFDEKDVKGAFIKVQDILSDLEFKDDNDLIDCIDKTYLNRSRKHLIIKFNQALARHQFTKNIESFIHCLHHKPRSGKTITMLLMSQLLLNKGYDRILILTSVPDTIKSFISELDKYYEFSDIVYKTQANFMDVNEDFRGIVF